MTDAAKVKQEKSTFLIFARKKGKQTTKDEHHKSLTFEDAWYYLGQEKAYTQLRAKEMMMVRLEAGEFGDKWQAIAREQIDLMAPTTRYFRVHPLKNKPRVIVRYSDGSRIDTRQM